MGIHLVIRSGLELRSQKLTVQIASAKEYFIQRALQVGQFQGPFLASLEAILCRALHQLLDECTTGLLGLLTPSTWPKRAAGVIKTAKAAPSPRESQRPWHRQRAGADSPMSNSSC